MIQPHGDPNLPEEPFSTPRRLEKDLHRHRSVVAQFRAIRVVR
jgi:hypothetical protein